jgi:hypothetical protein
VNLDELEKLARAATPGPWTSDVWIETDGNGWRATGPHHEAEAHDHGSEPGSPDEQAAQADARFIAACDPTTVLALLAVAKAAREIIEHLTAHGATEVRALVQLEKAIDALDAGGSK